MPTTSTGFRDSPNSSGSDALAAIGPTLSIQIQFGQDPCPNSIADPDIQKQLFPALVDTGASKSCIDSALARRLNLPVIDRQNIAGVSGIFEVNVHLAQVHVQELNFTIPGSFAAVHLTAAKLPYFALLGRDFLQHFTMTYKGRTGTVIISND